MKLNELNDGLDKRDAQLLIRRLRRLMPMTPMPKFMGPTIKKEQRDMRVHDQGDHYHINAQGSADDLRALRDALKANPAVTNLRVHQFKHARGKYELEADISYR